MCVCLSVARTLEEKGADMLFEIWFPQEQRGNSVCKMTSLFLLAVMLTVVEPLQGGPRATR